MQDKYKYIPIKNRVDEMLEFLRNKIPLMFDMESGDLKYDIKSMYYQIYKYIRNKEGKD